MNGNVLFISPHRADVGTLAEMLTPTALPLDHAASVEEARAKLLRDSYDAVLTEDRLPDGDWKDVLSLTGEVGVSAPVVVTSRLADDRFWVEVLSLGAYDLLVQPFHAGEVCRILTSARAQTPAKPLGAEPANGKAESAAA